MQDLNKDVFDLIFGLAHRSEWIDRFAVFAAQYLPYVLFLSALVVIFSEFGWKKKIIHFSHLVLVLVLARGVVVEILNYFFPVERPFQILDITPLFQAGGLAFPSSHAVVFFGLAVVIFCINKEWGFWYFLFAALNAFARVFTGVHWPADVLTGAFLGVAAGFGIYSLIEIYVKRIVLPGASGEESEVS